ncbi:hypothetical protein [Mycobacterium sp.]|uniref:Rv1815 family serine proteinase n=1 Tax=Mycobacterium sp. TaxID=1785 RepID=UPI001286D420|nr:hypothetical protein [Mycobacterium sp.]KAA8968202.1 MAG: hypothetical protein F6Q13_05210 [Mycobacterium sp.]
MFATTVGATVLAAGMGPTAKADQVVVFPGMEIHQAGHLCTLGYVDPVRRVAFTAGHCHGDGPVTDEDDHVIGTSATFRANTADGAPVAADQFVADYESIVLADDVTPNNVLPGGRVLESIPGVVARPGEPVCHFGIVTGESCGTIASVNNGWFTIGHGFTSEKGDSGGPVYVVNGPGRAAIVGLFNSIWGDFRTAVSWQAIAQQVAEDVQGASPGAAPAS